MDKDAYIVIGMSILFFVSVAYTQYDTRIRAIERSLNKLTLITTPVKYSPMERFKMSHICPDYHYTVTVNGTEHTTPTVEVEEVEVVVSTASTTPIVEVEEVEVVDTTTPIVEVEVVEAVVEVGTTPIVELEKVEVVEVTTPTEQLIVESIGEYVEVTNAVERDTERNTKVTRSWIW
jgi:hypothetical protein